MGKKSTELTRGTVRGKEGAEGTRGHKKLEVRRVALGRHLAGKAPSRWEHYTYPEGVIVQGPPSVKRKLSIQDSEGQPGRHESLKER